MPPLKIVTSLLVSGSQSTVTAKTGEHAEALRFILQVVEAPGASNCIGPGCSNVAQPDSVYCSSDCILKHAAATMKSLSAGKEQKPKPKDKTKMKPEKLILPKCSVQVS